MSDFAKVSDSELETWIANHERQRATSTPLYHSLLEERARRSSHQLNVDRSLQHLRECARQHIFTTYGKVAEVNGVEWSQARRLIGRHLDRCLDICHTRDWPYLTAICVKQSEISTGELSGDSLKGYVAGVRRLGVEVTDPVEFLKRSQRECFEWAAKSS